ncbi:hypothetical protein FSP39_025108 [Pinctada imbricata]|uniref:EF-hand domain-containing protein n=1 Tax=Pinctada imbricata TaxID=66713 RepID=A0AA88XQT9_PINIB|nr:hypothetical protein FSP39_025108 [Pinctada imbricata]
MDVWNHYDNDGNGFIEGEELESFLVELVTSVNSQDVGPEVVSRAAMEDAKSVLMNAFDENSDGRIDIAELAQILPMEENFLLLFRRANPLESSVEFMKVWRTFDKDCSGYIEADELKEFIQHLLNQSKRTNDVTEEQLITYTDTMLQLFDRNKDGKLQISEMAKLLPVKENFLCRPVFKTPNCLNSGDIDRVFSLYDRDGNNFIENDELDGFLKDLIDLVEEDFDEEDMTEWKKTLLRNCDVNNDGRIDKNELKMLLLEYNQIASGESQG